MDTASSTFDLLSYLPYMGYFAVFVFLFWAFWLWFGPVYGIWEARKSGQAQLANAEYAEQVAMAEANARLKAATANKEAEIIEASAVAESIRTIGDALSENEGYLRWQWIKMMDETDNSVIYVPTEANLPILEAGNRKA